MANDNFLALQNLMKDKINRLPGAVWTDNVEVEIIPVPINIVKCEYCGMNSKVEDLNCQYCGAPLKVKYCMKLNTH